MTGRELVFSNSAGVRLLTDRFVPVADDVSRLQVSEDAIGRFFRHVAVQGHMKGRSGPENSHQGTYAFTADGVTLASGNPLEADATLALLVRALDAWEAGDGSGSDSASAPGLPDEWNDHPAPEPGGAVLRMVARDLPRPGGLPPGQEHYATQWNLDHVWLRAQDVRELVPETVEIGEERDVSDHLLTRIARFHLRDFVRGEPGAWGPDAVQRIGLTSRVVDRCGNWARLMLTGEVCLREDVTFRDAHRSIEWTFQNSLDAMIAGEAVWNLALDRFDGIDVLVAGQRCGAHRYNVRTADPGPAPIGFAFELAGDAPGDRTPPHVLRTWMLPGEPEPSGAMTIYDEPYY